MALADGGRRDAGAAPASRAACAAAAVGGAARSEQSDELGQGRPQRDLPVRLGQEVQALPRPLRLTRRASGTAEQKTRPLGRVRRSDATLIVSAIPPQRLSKLFDETDGRCAGHQGAGRLLARAPGLARRWRRRDGRCGGAGLRSATCERGCVGWCAGPADGAAASAPGAAGCAVGRRRSVADRIRPLADAAYRRCRTICSAPMPNDANASRRPAVGGGDAGRRRRGRRVGPRRWSSVSLGHVFGGLTLLPIAGHVLVEASEKIAAVSSKLVLRAQLGEEELVHAAVGAGLDRDGRRCCARRASANSRSSLLLLGADRRGDLVRSPG